MRSVLLLLALLSAAECVLAQSNSRTDPADPRIPAPLSPYQSAFPGYLPFVEQKNDWKQVNQEVADAAAMGSMQHKPGMSMPGTNAKSGDAAKGKEGMPGDGMGQMKRKPDAIRRGSGANAGQSHTK